MKLTNNLPTPGAIDTTKTWINLGNMESLPKIAV